MRHAPQRTIRLVVLALLGFTVLGAHAQEHLMRLPAVRSAPLPGAMEESTLVRQARAAMRLGQYAKARKLAEAAKGVFADLEVGYTSKAREVLAETAVLENRPAEALAQISPLPGYMVNQRLAMTKALALIELGDLTQARALVLREIGTPKSPGHMRGDWGFYHASMDEDPSVDALTATAYLIRMTWHSNPVEYPEALADLRAARRLAPNDPTIHLQYAEALIQLGAYDDAKAELDEAGAAKTGAGADPRFKAKLQAIREQRLTTMKLYPNGRPRPDEGDATKP